MLRRNAEGKTILSVNMHGAGDDRVYCEFEPDVVPGIGPVINVYRMLGDERKCVFSLSRNGWIGVLRFLPTVLNEASRLERRLTRR